MRYAIISDIHANAAALRAVLTDAQDCGSERVICLGDVLGYGPEPVETLEMVYKRVHVCLAGNHDDAISGRGDVSDFSAFAASAAARQSVLLSDKAKTWLRSLPYVWGKGEFACAHGEFSDPKSFFYIDSPEEAMPSWTARKEKLLFVGHTHEPCIFVIGQSGVPRKHSPMDFQLEAGKRYIVNVGSVGYPRSGSCRSCYAIWDDRTRVVTFRTLPFDLEGYREKMNGRGLEEAPWIGRRQKERERPNVRDEIKFGNSQQDPSKAKPSAKRSAIRVVRGKANDNSQQPSANSKLAVTRLPLIAAGAAAVLAIAGIAGYYVNMSRAPRDVAMTPPPLQDGKPSSGDVAMAPSPAHDSVPTLGEFKQHVDGWSYAVESEKEQYVSFNGKPSILNVTSNGKRRIAFRKEIAIRNGDLKVHVKVKVLPKGVGTTRYELLYFDGNGVAIRGANEFLESRTKNVKLTPPKGAVRAQLFVEYVFSGSSSIELPYFTTVSKADPEE